MHLPKYDNNFCKEGFVFSLFFVKALFKYSFHMKLCKIKRLASAVIQYKYECST